MLKSFREQNVDVSKQISDEIDRVVDDWVRQLLTKMVATPMDPSAKRSLWDRFKGTLANVWYGGKYNPQNPYYWKHRFGDELGATTENFDPSVFSLKEYHELKTAVDKFESFINEQELPAGAEKLRLVRTIRDEADRLKKTLKDIFAKSCSQPTATVGSESEAEAEVELKQAQPQAQSQPQQSATAPKRGRGRPRKIPVSVPTEDDMPPPPNQEEDKNKYEVGSEERYKKMLPKEENQEKSLEDLKNEEQTVDLILNPGFLVNHFYDSDNDANVASAAEHEISVLNKLKRDAEKRNESQEILDKIDSAIKRMEEFKL
jgi:hypothetical protein